MTANPFNLSLAAAHSVAAVDLDNLTVGKDGFDRIDIRRFCARVRYEAGLDCITAVFANGMKASVASIWNECGAQVIRTVTNGDEMIAHWLLQARSARQVIIASGDWWFHEAATYHRNLGHHVQVWSRRERTSYQLAFAADRVDFIDSLLYQRPDDAHRVAA